MRMASGRLRAGGRGFALLALAALAGGVAGQDQPPLRGGVASEELDEPEMALVPLGEPSPLDPALVAELAAAQEAFVTDGPTARPLLAALIGQLEPLTAAGHPDDQAKQALARALVLQADLRLARGDDGAVADLDRALRLRPALDLGELPVSSTLRRRFDHLREELIGFLAAETVDPPDIDLRIDGRRVDPLAGPLPVLAGGRRIVAQRIGYAPLVAEVSIRPGTTETVDLLLERVAPVLRLATSPSGATVMVDGVARGTTGGAADPGRLPAGLAARLEAEGFSAPFELDDLGLGAHQLEVRSAGYRPYRAALSMVEAIDYEMPPIVLERERGTLLLRQLPADATVQVDGEAVRPDRRGDSVRLEVVPGEHQVLVARGPAQMFARALRVADRQTVEIAVDLKPGLGLLGVIGGDRQAAANLRRWMRDSLGGGRFTAIEHAAGPVLGSLGLDPRALRAGAGGVDWRTVQRQVADTHAGMVYVLAVLSDDLLATHAELFVWAPPPAPPEPDRLRIALDDRTALDGLAAALNRSLALRRTWLGAQLFDGANDLPVVAHADPAGPAAALAVGDRITAVDGQAVRTARAVTERVRAAEIGEPLSLTVDRGGTVLDLRVELASSPQVVAAGEGLIRATVFADLELLEARVGPADRWLVQLNRAQALIDAGEWVDAARELRAIEAPERAGVGRGTVDYLLGVALQAAGPSYLESARAAFERSAAATGARLDHDDGPWMAPRARARLHALAAQAPP